ncbi:helix-turn-helix transcriptional regulator [Mesorhizobium sp. L103C119B0]|uniref:helix-turn-helix domain-containing protein n=1 Tax=Mesorhizobium sp. L103C119B0 TaxID=1287085 RepID=UPI00040F5937|nr:helix-turn-helix transcriptional regulator [Mesorhizobium sp. L103C119B0]
MLKPQRSVLLRTGPKPKIESDPHPADQHVGRQIATVRVQSDVSQAQLARSIGISFQQLQKYENARNRVSASMLTRSPVRSAFLSAASLKACRETMKPASRRGPCRSMSAWISLPARRVGD